MIDPSLEPKGLDPDTPPLAAFMEAANVRYDAENGSMRLLKALLGQRPRVQERKRSQVVVQLPWAKRKSVLEWTRHLIRAAAGYYGIRAEDLTGKRGNAELSRRRQIVMHVARHHIGASYQNIGYCLRRDHSTVVHGCRIISEDPSARGEINALTKLISRTKTDLSPKSPTAAVADAQGWGA